MSKWTCAGCGIEVIDGLKTCACDTMVMVEDGGLGRSEWMHYPVAPPDLELAILECKTFEDFLAVQETVAVLPAATALAHLNGPDSSMVGPGYQRPGFDSLSGPPSLASPSKRVERLEAALKPFADVLDEGEGIEGVVLTFTAPDGHQVVTAVPSGAFKAARQALGDRS